MNNKLHEVQNDWYKNIFCPYQKENDNNEKAKISNPFFSGVCDEYIKSNKRLMIVGQESMGFHPFDSKWGVKDSRDWSIIYLRYQLRYINFTAEVDNNGIKKRRNSSQFWGFFKQFSNDGIVPCWNNIDKAQLSVPKKNGNYGTKSLTEDMEIAFNSIIPSINKTLFQKEVEITKPNVVVFVTGPNYRISMEAALNIKKDSLSGNQPSYENGCVDITDIANLGVPTFWTYHPRNIVNKRNTLNRDEIVKAIKEAFNI